MFLDFINATFGGKYALLSLVIIKIFIKFCTKIYVAVYKLTINGEQCFLN